MKNSLKGIGVTTVAIVLGVGAAGVASAHTINADTNESAVPQYHHAVHAGMHMQEHQAVQDALDQHDYKAFVAAIGDKGPFAGKVTQDNFDILVQAHDLMKAGDMQGAKALFDSLGITPSQRMRHGGHRFGAFHKPLDPQKAEAMKTALENDDYDTWKAFLLENSPRFAQMTQEKFEALRQMHAHRKAGDKEGMKSLAETLGMKRFGHMPLRQ